VGPNYDAPLPSPNPEESIPNFDNSFFKTTQVKDESMRSIKNLLNSFDDNIFDNNNILKTEGYDYNREVHTNRVNNIKSSKITLSSMLKNASSGLHFHDTKRPEIKHELVERMSKNFRNQKINRNNMFNIY